MSTAMSASEASPYLKFLCLACGYIYDEALGDPDGGLAPGTRYADIPDDWMCPICGVGKTDFELFDADNSAAVGLKAPASRSVEQRGKLPLLIVGAGIAGWSVAEAVRRLQPSRPIVVLTSCSGDVYHKPQLSVAIAQQKTLDSLKLESGADAASRLEVQLLPNTWLISIDRARRRARTTRGSIRYDKLVLATGACPAPLPMDDASLKLIWRINNLQHYQAFRTRLGNQARRIVIIGAGLVGCELADDLAVAGHTVTLLDRAERPLSAFAPAEKSLALMAALKASGIGFRGECIVQKVEKNAEDLAVILATGETLICDIVLAATGLRTDLRIAKSASLDCDQGIAVDGKSMATADPHIFALGDCASVDKKTYRYIEPIHRQAMVLASTLAGQVSAGFDTRPPLIRVKTRSLPLTL